MTVRCRKEVRREGVGFGAGVWQCWGVAARKGRERDGSSERMERCHPSETGSNPGGVGRVLVPEALERVA